MTEIGPDHLAYVGRRNNVIKLSQGDFVAVANPEAIIAGARMIRQIFLYGNSGRPALLAVLVPTDEARQSIAGDDVDLKAALRETLSQTARSAELQSDGLPVDFLIEEEPFSSDNGLLSGSASSCAPASRNAPATTKMHGTRW